jgi:glycosyltransferase involved in cell wall biosynthesis
VQSDTLVFIPAWNEEDNLPAVLDELHAGLPESAVLVVDDGSTDSTADGRAQRRRVVSFGENRGLQEGIAAGYAYADSHGYDYVGRVDADGQHPVDELARLLEIVRDGAPTSQSDRVRDRRRLRGVPIRAVGEPQAGTSVLRRAMRAALGRPFHDATSGMYAANRRAMPALGIRYSSGAPEVESLLRLREAGLHVVEVPVHARAGAESQAARRQAVRLVLTVVGTLLLYGVWRKLRRPR